MALEGLRILDFTRLGFGAQATLICGCLGAEVIRVESTRFPDAIRVMPPFVPEPGERGEAFGAATLANAAGAPSPNRGGIFYKYNTGGKKSITVNARHPKGLAVLKDLVAHSDVVTESFAAGTMERWGLPYDVMRAIRPDVIYVSMCGFGHEGPDTDHVTMGPTAQALTGLTFMVGLPDRPPAGWSFSYLDHVGGYLGAIAILAGVIHRGRTGEGQHIDVSQLEPATALSGALLLDAMLNERPSRRAGLPDGQPARPPPHRAVGRVPGPGRRQMGGGVVSDRCAVGGARARHGRPAVGGRSPFRHRGRARRRTPMSSTPMSRRGRASATATTPWSCSNRPACRRAWCRTPPTASSATRSWRRARHYTMLGNAEVEPLPLEGVPFRMSSTPPHTGGALHRGPPRLGEDNEAVLGEVLGMSAADVAALFDDGALS